MGTQFATSESHYRGSNSTGRLRPAGFQTLDQGRKFCGQPGGEACAPTNRMGRIEADQNQSAADLFPLLQRVARKMRAHLPAHIEVDDLVGAGSVGLVDAVRKFDPSKRVKIESYAQHRIRGAILDSLRSMDGASRDLRRKIKQAEKVHSELEARLGHPAGDQEMAQAQGISLKNWYRRVREFQPLGIDWLRPRGYATEPQPTAESLPAKSNEDQFALCYRREKIDILNRALTSLSVRERLIICLYYARERTMKQIGSQLRIDESRVSQLHSAALVRLRKAVKSLSREPQRCPGPMLDGLNAV
ncbi:MAG TPA: FliA/WhiG family RNA polymerase sigma factor [Terriglobia bacterium]|nr:FliA/WhiG family RNA polymerase sigma factor [Terriglobia bacterium]